MRLTFDWVVRETGVEIKARNGFPVPLRVGIGNTDEAWPRGPAQWVHGRRLGEGVCNGESEKASEHSFGYHL